MFPKDRKDEHHKTCLHQLVHHSPKEPETKNKKPETLKQHI
jgi:hypothetical protein